MLQCCLYCECNVSANRTQSDESWLSKAMLSEVQPDFAVGNVSANRMQNLKTCFRKLC